MKPAHFTSEFQRMARSHVKRESLQVSGRKGYDALIRKGKARIASKKAAEWRLHHPSNLEKIVISWLDELIPGRYLREENIGDFYADFVFGLLVIEVNGKQWHETMELRPDQAQRDKGKYQEFTKQGYTILVLPESKIKSGEAKKELEAILATM